jgi:fructose-1,6-bisphosphatase I / sedoheptulose-1,7-bisphosphatase
MLTDHTTLAQFLVDELRSHPAARADLESLILDVALACKAIADHAALGALLDPLGGTGRELATIADDCFLRATERGGFLLVVVPLDGSSDVDVNASAGSIFSIMRAPEPGKAATPQDLTTQDFLQPGTAQVCAGYALYGPATTFVLTVGRGVHGFTLHPALGEFVLTREAIRVPRHPGGSAVSTSNRRFREPGARWVTPLVARTHRVLTRGGAWATPGQLRLLHEANPVAFLVEQAGGAASTGRERVLDVVPTGLHQRVPLIFGAQDEVALISRHHRQRHDRPYDLPLYGGRGLFRAGTG